jgi:hypothetical protein
MKNSEQDEVEDILANLHPQEIVSYMLDSEIDFDGEDHDPAQILYLTNIVKERFCKLQGTEDALTRNLQMFGQPLAGQGEDRYNRLLHFVSNIKMFVDGLPAENQDVTRQIHNNLQLIMNFVSDGYRGYVYLHRQTYSGDAQKVPLVGSLPEDQYNNVYTVEFKKHQQLIRYYLLRTKHRQYRRYKGELYKPKFITDDHIFTHYFEYQSSIKDFLFQECYPFIKNQWLFQSLTDKPGNIGFVESWLTNCRDSSLPELLPSRYVFAFNNGVYDVKQARFYLYVKAGGHPYSIEQLPHDKIACNFIACDFDFNKYDDPYDIPTPAAHSILAYQKIPDDACRWCYALIGRLFFNVGELDNWQVHLMFKGTAGTGKSTLLHLASLLYQDVDVGNLMSDGRRDFGIEHLMSKFLVICLDLNRKMTSLPQATWNQMVSGEKVTVDRKNKTAMSSKWTAQCAFAGNDYPPWSDQAGNVVRRLVVFLFTHYVRDVDPDLEQRCKEQLGPFLRKCVEQYYDFVLRYGRQGIWDRGVLPEFLWDCRYKMQSQTNGLQSFLLSEKCIVDGGETVSFTAFAQQYRKYCESNKMQYQALTVDFYTSVFSPLNIEVRQAPKDAVDLENYDGFERRKYLKGVSLDI